MPHFKCSYLFSGSRKAINSELWHACAGPLVCLPQVGSLAYYFPQGHSEQVRFIISFVSADECWTKLKCKVNPWGLMLCQHIIKRSNRVVVLVVLFVLFRFCGSVLCIFCSVEVDLFLFIQLCLRKLISMLLMKMQVAVSTKRMATSQIPNYPNLPSQLLCQVQNVTLHVCSLWSIHTCSRSEWS